MTPLQFQTTALWSEPMWRQAGPIYAEAFADKGGKSEALIRGMFARGLCQLHTASVGSNTAAMALTGFAGEQKAVIIDYIAVSEAERSRGTGRQLVDYIKRWAKEAGCRGIVIEVEAEPTDENIGRIRFWQRCGFALTEAVHQYIWVPEPYRAMVFHLTETEEHRLPEDGEALFRCITRFHRKAYRKS
ncbi:MAG: family N-acetyltransferase [Paenibacillus sp.]|jgi:GNAT superfamily N-acetyltransferase|nr:family N-acetyltransferase [Paenibacillus sp.]